MLAMKVADLQFLDFQNLKEYNMHICIVCMYIYLFVYVYIYIFIFSCNIFTLISILKSKHFKVNKKYIHNSNHVHVSLTSERSCQPSWSPGMQEHCRSPRFEEAPRRYHHRNLENVGGTCSRHWQAWRIGTLQPPPPHESQETNWITRIAFTCQGKNISPPM